MIPRNALLAAGLAALLFPWFACAQGFGPLAEPQGPVSSAGMNPYGPAAGEERPRSSRTIIESENGASFDNAQNTADFTGHVVVRDPQFDLTCEKLHAVLKPDRKGLAKVIATGSVVIVQEKKNERGDVVKSVGKCGKATYDTVTGDVTLEEWPQVQQGINSQVATQVSTVMILNAKGRSRTIGPSKTQIVDQGGARAVTP